MWVCGPIAQAQPSIMPIAQVSQPQTDEIDRAMAEGLKFVQAGDQESLKKAIDQFETALRLSISSKNQSRQALSLVLLGRAYEVLDKKQKTIDFYRQALPLYKALGDRPSEATLLNNLGILYATIDENKKALEAYNQALVIYEALGDRLAVATTFNNIGAIYNDLSDHQKALKFYSQALVIYRSESHSPESKLRQRSGEASTLNNIGTLYNILGEQRKALDSLTQALRIRRELIKLPGEQQRQQKSEATLLNNIGGIYDSLGEKQKALDFYLQALPIRRSVGDRVGEATTLNNIGATYRSLGEKQKAIVFYNQALSIYREIQNQSGKGTTLNNMGLVYAELGEKQKALGFYNQALAIRQAIGDRLGESTTLSNIGAVYSSLGEPKKALEFNFQALVIKQKIQDRTGEANLFNNIANIYNNLGERQKSLEYNNRSLQIYRAVNDRSGQALSMNNLGLVYSILGDWQKAMEMYNQALLLTRSVGDRAGEATILNAIAYIYDVSGEKQKALDLYTQVLPLRRAVGDRSGEATTFNNMGNVYSSLGNKQKALELYEQSLMLCRAVSNRLGEATALNNIGLIHSTLGNSQKALESYQQALPLRRLVGDRDGEATTLNNIGLLFRQQNQLEQAIAFYKQSVSTYETLRNDIKSLSRSQQVSYTQTISYTYRNLASLLIQQNRLSEAQQVLELLKIRELKEIEPDKQQPKTPIRQLPISDSEKQEIAKINPAISNEIQTELLPKLDQLSPTNPLNQSAQALTKPNSALIYHLITADKLWIVLVTPDGKLQRFSSNQTKAQLETLTQNIRSQLEKCERSACTTPDTQTLNQTTQKLYEHLFPNDLKTALTQTQHLTLALDGSLRNIPIAALHTGQQYLIERYSLSTIIAAQLTDSQDKIPTNPAQTPILALGTSQSARLEVPDFIDRDRQDRFAPLANVPIELNAIVKSDRNPKAFPGKQLLNDQFTLQNIQQQLPNHRILHIASHGIFRPNSLDYSYILLGNQQRWSIAALDQDAQLFQNLHLITLSACQTGLSDRDKNGMEIAGMSYAFLSKGAKAINASLWSVDDASTAILMQQFYQNLTQNQSKAQSLQNAQLHLLRTPRSQLINELSRSLAQPPVPGIDTRWTFNGTPPPSTTNKPRDYSHPYYWAAFTLIGNSL